MRAYDRNELKRDADTETMRALIETQDLTRPVSASPGVPATWTEFTQAFEQAAHAEARGGQLQSLLRISRCPHLGVVRGFDCGKETTGIRAWCGAPYCPSCAHERGASAARFLRETWTDARLLVVSIPVGAPGRLALPQSTAVAAVRDAWSRVTRRVQSRTGLPRLQPMPRLLVHPGGITQFVPLPWSPERDDVTSRLMADEVRVACKHIGLRDVRAESLSTEQAIQRFVGALTMEAACFAASVAADQERLAALDWRSAFPGDRTRDAARAACARRWVRQVKDRNKSARRQLCLGSGDALPAPPKPEPQESHQCPTHGGRCQTVAVRVRDWTESGDMLWEGPPDALSESPTRAQIGAFFDRIAKSPARKAG